MGQDGRPLLSSRCSLDSEMSSLLARGGCWPVLTIALAVWHHWFVGLAFFECGLFMAQTTLHLLLSHYYRRSTTCLFCGRSYLPKGHSKGPDVVGGAKAIRSVLFSLSAASLDPLTAVRRRRFAIHAGTRHTTVARTRPRTSAPARSCISGVLKDPFRKDTLSNFVISLFTYQLHAIFLGLFLSKTLQ